MACAELEDGALILSVQTVYVVLRFWSWKFFEQGTTSRSACPSVQPFFFGVVSQNLLYSSETARILNAGG